MTMGHWVLTGINNLNCGVVNGKPDSLSRTLCIIIMFVCLCECACVMQYIVCVHMDVCKVGKDNESSMSSCKCYKLPEHFTQTHTQPDPGPLRSAFLAYTIDVFIKTNQYFTAQITHSSSSSA